MDAQELLLRGGFGVVVHKPDDLLQHKLLCVGGLRAVDDRICGRGGTRTDLARRVVADEDAGPCLPPIHQPEEREDEDRRSRRVGLAEVVDGLAESLIQRPQAAPVNNE